MWLTNFIREYFLHFSGNWNILFSSRIFYTDWSNFWSHNYFDNYCRNPHFLILQIYNIGFLSQLLGIYFPIISGLSRYKIRYFCFIFVPQSIIIFAKFVSFGKIIFFKNQRISLYIFSILFNESFRPLFPIFSGFLPNWNLCYPSISFLSKLITKNWTKFSLNYYFSI